jgi:hypothetical protein
VVYPRAALAGINFANVGQENIATEAKNRQRSLEEKREQENLDAECTRQIELLKKRGSLAIGSQIAKGKQPAVRSDQPGNYGNQFPSGVNPNIPYERTTTLPRLGLPASSLSQPLMSGALINPESSTLPLPRPLATPIQSRPRIPIPLRNEPTPPPSSTRSEPDNLPSRTHLSADPQARHSEGGSSGENAMSHDPISASFLIQQPPSSISPTEAAEASLRQDNNPYRNGRWRAYLLNKQGAGSVFITEMEGSIPHFEMT